MHTQSHAVQLWDARSPGCPKLTSRCDAEYATFVMAPLAHGISSALGARPSLTSVALHHSQEEVIAVGSSDGVLGIWDKRQVFAPCFACVLFDVFQFRAPIALTQAHSGPG